MPNFVSGIRLVYAFFGPKQTNLSREIRLRCNRKAPQIKGDSIPVKGFGDQIYPILVGTWKNQQSDTVLGFFR